MRLLDIGDAAERLGTTERHMRALIANRKIDYIKVGRLVRFDPVDARCVDQGPNRHGGAMRSDELRTRRAGAITRTHDSSGQPAGSPETLAEWALKYAAAGLEVFPVDPDTKAPIGATEGANGETIWMATKGHTSATSDRRNHRRMVATATRCPNRRPHTQRRGRARHRPPPRRPRHMGHHRRRPRPTDNTPSRFRPQRRRLSHLVSEPRPRPHRRRRRHRRAAPGAPLHHFAAVTHPATGQPTHGSDADNNDAAMPEWLTERLTPAPKAPVAPPAPRITPNPTQGGDGPTPAEWYNDNASGPRS